MYASSSDTFYKYYAARQRGGALATVDGIPVYRASRRTGQGGAGLGDMLRSAFRWFLPVALRGASAFANAFLKSHDQGATFGEAAKSAIAPTLSVAARAVRNRMAAKEKKQQVDQETAMETDQTGSGRKRRRVYKGKRSKRTKRSKKSSTKKRHLTQFGFGRRKRTSKKRKQSGGKKRKQSGGKKRKATKRRRRRASTPSATSYNF